MNNCPPSTIVVRYDADRIGATQDFSNGTHISSPSIRRAILSARYRQSRQRTLPPSRSPSRSGNTEAFDAFPSTFLEQFPVLCALRLAPMLFVRPGELRQVEWTQIDLDKGEWRYRVTKTNTDHLVPLATQAVAILLTGNGRYVFPGARDIKRPMSEAAINAALRRLGDDTRTEITGHGFRGDGAHDPS